MEPLNQEIRTEAMNLFFHQLRTDLVHQRWLLAGLGLLFVGMALDIFPCELLFILGWAFLLLEFMQSDRLMTSQGFWQTRPFGRGRFLGIKLGLVLLSFIAFHALIGLADWWRYGLHWHQAIRGTILLGLLTAGFYAFIAAAATLCKSRRDFLLFMLLGFLVVIGTLIITEKANISVHSPSVNPMLGINVIGVLAAGLCWWLGPGCRQEGRAFGIWFLGLALAVIAALFWPWSTLGAPKAKEVHLTARLLEPGDSLATDADCWYQRFAVKPGDGLQARLLDLKFAHPDSGTVYPSLRTHRNPSEDTRTIRTRYPSGTRWLDTESDQTAKALTPHISPIQGSMSVEVFRWVRTEISAPSVGARAPSSRGGYVQIRELQTQPSNAEMAIWRLHPGILRTREPLPQANLSSGEFPERVYVLYHPEQKTAIRALVQHSNNHSSTTTLALVIYEVLNVGIPQSQLSLSGLTVEEWLAGARLDIYERQIVGRATVPFREELDAPTFEVTIPRMEAPKPRPIPNANQDQTPLGDALAKGNIEAVRQRLRTRAPLTNNLAGAALQLAAQQATKKDTEDLHWHFIHAQGDQSTAVEAFEKSQSLDARRAILGAWKRAYFGLLGFTSASTLAPHAARYGNKEALRQAVATLTQADGVGIPHKFAAISLRELRRAIPYEGTNSAFINWVHEHWDSLVWNAARSEWQR